VIHPRTGQRVGQRSAREVFNAITDAAWRTGDPGLVSLDAINRANPTPELGPIEATNPCGEIPLLPHEACNLGSINLAQREGGSEIDWEKLRATTRAAVRFLDDVIDVNNYPIPEIEHMARGNRKTGLGVMGFAEILIRLGISYDSDEAIAVAGQVIEFINNER
jgi:ribonucleoside-diphosphate reductase alpha chain